MLFNTTLPLITAPTLVGKWDFEAGPCSIIYDTSGFHHNGVLSGFPWPTFSAMAAVGMYSIMFSVATADCVEIPFPSPPAGDDTRSLWLRTPLCSSVSSVLSFYSSSVPGYGSFLQVHLGRLQYTVQSPTQSFTATNASSPVLCDNAWHFVAATRSASQLTLYVDGYAVLAVDISLENSLFALATQNENMLNLGCRPGAEYFTGFLDDVRIYSNALSATDVLSLCKSFL